MKVGISLKRLWAFVHSHFTPNLYVFGLPKLGPVNKLQAMQHCFATYLLTERGKHKYTGGRDMQKHITSAVKPLRIFLSIKDFNLLKFLTPSARSFFNFMTACYFPCLHVT